MKHINLFNLFLLLVLPQLAFAQQISEGEAMNRAMSFFAEHSTSQSGIKKAPSQTSNNQISLAYTAGNDKNKFFYVYNRGENDGYVIVGGDEQAKEILAYVPQGHFVYDNIPDNMKWWLGQYEQEIDSAIVLFGNKPQSARSTIRRTSTSTTYKDIPDLITTKWGQGAPYNNAIPKWVHDDTTTEFPTGCTATALAQILHHWQYPTQGQGNNTYRGVFNGDTITFSADFGNTTYDWANMLDDYSIGNPTQAQTDAVALLMYHVGVAIHTEYRVGGSAWVSLSDEASHNVLVSDLSTYFGYSSKARFKYHSSFSEEEWKNAIYHELSNNRPVLYIGQMEGSSIGHAFVCHGYSASLDMFSMNWGWSGIDDGFFSISSTDALNGYGQDQIALFGFQPGNISSSEPMIGDLIGVDGYYYTLIDPLLKHVALSRNDTIMYDQDENDLTKIVYKDTVVIPATIVYQDETYTVTSIGENAFKIRYVGGGLGNNYFIQSIFLPNTITTFSKSAFEGCYYLDTISLPPLVTNIPEHCFYYCENLKKIENLDNIRSLEDFCFGYCGFTDFIVPEGVTYLPAGVFMGCTKLASVTLPQSLSKINSAWTFSDAPLVKMICHAQTPPASNGMPFSSAVRRGVLYVPQASIQDYRDSYWNEWGHIEAIETMQPNDIGNQFYSKGFTYRVLYNGVSISRCGLYGVVIIPDSVSYNGNLYPVVGIETEAFWDNYAEYAYLPSTLNYIDARAFYHAAVTTIKIPESVTEIADNAFWYAESLRSVDIPGSIRNLLGFTGCRNLVTVKIRNGVEEIDQNAFRDCNSLPRIELPSSVSQIEQGSFTICNNLKSMVVTSPVMEIGFFAESGFGNVFDESLDAGTLYVTDSLLNTPTSYVYTGEWLKWSNVQVYVPASSIQVSQSTLNLLSDEQATLSASVAPFGATNKQVIWSTSDPNVAIVGYDGTVKARNLGFAWIYAEAVSGEGIVDSCWVVVSDTSSIGLVGYATYSSDHNYTVSNAHAYKASVSETTITLTELNGVIPAQTGVLLKGTAGENANIIPTQDAPTADVTGNDLIGTGSGTYTVQSTDHIYCLTKNTDEFNKVNTDVVIPKNKAYFSLDADVVADAPLRIVVQENAITDMEQTVHETVVSKQIVDGHLVIIRDGKIYNAIGSPIR